MRLGSVLVASVVLLAGCLGADVTQAHQASFSYEGSEAGVWERRLLCDDDATLQGVGRLEEGTLDVRITSDTGAVVFEDRYAERDFVVRPETVEGAQGLWKVRVERSDGEGVFRGQYRFVLEC